MKLRLFKSKRGASMARVILAMCFILLLAGAVLAQTFGENAGVVKGALKYIY
jgi:hypothetical protein